MTDQFGAEPPQIVSHSASQLAQLIRAGDVSVFEVVEAHISRIESVNDQLNAVVIPLFDEARAEARSADEALRSGQNVGPLHGVPVTIKEQYRVSGTQTTLGASERIRNVYYDEGPLVTALRNAGAIILGKTNVIQTLAGWESDNPVYGRTNNPWNLGRTPGGSSGGEAAIVASGGSALGLAGDFGGSIRVPASFCGVHGFKPTAGRLSNDDFPGGLLTSGQETFIPQPGPIARTVEDLSLAMEVFGETSLQPTGDVVPPVPLRDPARIDLVGLRVGMYTDNGYFPISPGVKRAVEDAAAALQRLGATVETIRPPDASEAVRIFLRAASAGGSRDMFRLLGDEEPISQVAGLLRAVRIPSPLRPIVAKMMELRGQHRVAEVIRQVRPSSASDYFEIVEARNSYRQAFRLILDQANLHAVICPPVATPAFTHGSSEHLLPALSYVLAFNVLGTPAGVISTSMVRPGEARTKGRSRDMADIVAAKVDEASAGLPLGVQVVAGHWDDDIVLAIMAGLEAHFRTTPEYPQTPTDPASSRPTAQ
ncbi:MAG: amidase [Acidimicrobiales bacterium]